MRKLRNGLVLSVSVTSLLGLAAGAAAQNVPASQAGATKSGVTSLADTPSSAQGANVVEQVVVTARMRSETLQTVPVAVTAFSTQKLNDARVQSVADFINLTPNVSIVQSQSAGYDAITIRGISQVRNGESPVAVVVDGVQQVTSRQFNQDLFDVQQIEVLRGPQGALYGRDAIGGAILITTKQPTNTFAGDTQVSLGNGDNYRAEGSVSGPIIPDKLLFRLAGDYHYFGGLLDDRYLGQTVDYNSQEALRGQLKALLTDRLTADLRVGVDYTRGGGNYFQYQSANLDPASPKGCFLDSANPFGGPAPDANRVDRNDFCENNRGYNSRDIEDASLKLDYRTDYATVTNVASALHLREDLDSDQFPYTASRNVYGTDGSQTQWENNSSLSDELRITSPGNQRFRWMAGVYYLFERRYISTTTGLDEGLGILPVHGAPNGLDTVNPTLSFLADDNKNTSYAVFGNVAYDITSKLEASFAYRYDVTRLHHYVEPISTSTLPNGCATTDPAACVEHRIFSQGQPKFTLNDKLTSAIDLFTDYGVGFRTGQFNQSGAAEAANLPGVFDIVKPEVADTFEAGFKTHWFGNRLRINGTYFNTRDKNPAYFLFVGSIGAQILVNIDEVRLNGGELEVEATPIHGLDLFANYGYTSSNIKKYVFDPADKGNWAPYIPLDSWQIGAQYRYRLTDSYGLFGRFDVDHQGKQYWDPENSTARRAFELLNLRGGVENLRDHWSVIGYVNNLADKAYNAEFVDGGFVQPAEPRTYGVDLKYSF